MAKKDQEGTAQPDATAGDVGISSGDKSVYYNQGQQVSPREHQPAVPQAAEDANKAAEARAKAKTSSDVDAVSPTGMVTEPKVKSTTAADVNVTVSEQNVEGK